jgi:hypothetical protein
MFTKVSNWSRYVGPEPGMTGCRASPELLAEYRIAPDGPKIRAPRWFSDDRTKNFENRLQNARLILVAERVLENETGR